MVEYVCISNVGIQNIPHIRSLFINIHQEEYFEIFQLSRWLGLTNHVKNEMLHSCTYIGSLGPRTKNAKLVSTPIYIQIYIFCTSILRFLRIKFNTRSHVMKMTV